MHDRAQLINRADRVRLRRMPDDDDRGSRAMKMTVA